MWGFCSKYFCVLSVRFGFQNSKNLFPKVVLRWCLALYIPLLPLFRFLINLLTQIQGQETPTPLASAPHSPEGVTRPPPASTWIPGIGHGWPLVTTNHKTCLYRWLWSEHHHFVAIWMFLSPNSCVSQLFGTSPGDVGASVIKTALEVRGQGLQSSSVDVVDAFMDQIGYQSTPKPSILGPYLCLFPSLGGIQQAPAKIDSILWTKSSESIMCRKPISSCAHQWYISSVKMLATMSQSSSTVTEASS